MKGPQRNNALRFTTLVVMTACCMVVFFSIVVNYNLKKLVQLWGEDVQLTIYLSEEVQPSELETLRQSLEADQRLERVQLVTQQKALEDFRVQLSTYAPDLAKDDELLKLIPASFQAQLKSDIPSQAKVSVLEKISQELKAQPAVDDVSYGQDWVKKYATFLNIIEWGSLLIGLIIGAACLFVVSNSIRALVYARSEEIEIMEMIGATKSMIRKPFLLEGAMTGALCSVSSVLLIWGLYAATINQIRSYDGFLNLADTFSFPSIITSIVFVLSFVLMGALGAWLSVIQVSDRRTAAPR